MHSSTYPNVGSDEEVDAVKNGSGQDVTLQNHQNHHQVIEMQDRQSITFDAHAGGAALTQANIDGSAISSLGFQQFDTFIAKRSEIKKFHAADDNTDDFTD